MTLRGFVTGDRILQSTDSHADWCAAYGQLGPFRFVGASAIGKLHLHNVRPRDDAFAVRSAGPWLAIAVSDGVGSRKQSRYGASFAVEALCEQMLREADGQSVQESTNMGKVATPEDGGGADNKEQELVQPSVDLATSAPKKSWRPQDLWRHLGIGSGDPRPTLLEKEGIQEISITNSDVSRFGTTMSSPDFSEANAVRPSETINATDCGTLTWHWNIPTTSEQTESVALAADSVNDRTSLRTEEGFRRAFHRTHQGLEQFAQVRGLRMSELSCTLLGLLLNTNTGEMIVGHVGDGLIAMLHPAMGAQALVEPLTPEETGTVYPFTKSDWHEHFVVRHLLPTETSGITTYFLMTDGVAEDCINPPPDDVLTRWAKDMDREVRRELPPTQTATRLLRWLTQYEAPGSWDDRTLVVLIRS